MPDLTIKPVAAAGNKLILQDQAGGAVLTTADSGATVANATLTTPTIASMANCTFPAGHVLQTKAYHTAAVLTVTCASNTHTDLPTFVVAITPSSTSSKILVMLNIGGFNFSSTNYGVSGGGQLRRKIASGSFAGIGIGTANAIWNATFVLSQKDSYAYPSVHAIYLDSPNTTSECTYGIAVNDHNNGTQTFYLNQLGATNGSHAQAYASSIIVQEIAG